MSFVNQLEWSTNGPTVDNISGFNVARAGANQQIVINTDPEPTPVDWLYANTLLDQEFNKYGFYDQENNVNIVKASVPDSLKSQINNFEKKSSSYLLPAGRVGFTGLVGKPGSSGNEYVLKPNNGIPQTVADVPTIIYNTQLLLQKQKMSKDLNGSNLNFKVVERPDPKPIGFVNT